MLFGRENIKWEGGKPKRTEVPPPREEHEQERSVVVGGWTAARLKPPAQSSRPNPHFAFWLEVAESLVTCKFTAVNAVTANCSKSATSQ